MTWRLITSPLWVMACWTIRFCRALWASGFLNIPNTSWKRIPFFGKSGYSSIAAFTISKSPMTSLKKSDGANWFAYRYATGTVTALFVKYTSCTQWPNPGPSESTTLANFLKMDVAQKTRHLTWLQKWKEEPFFKKGWWSNWYIHLMQQQENRFVYFMFK